MELIDEYKACESPDYVNYGLELEAKHADKKSSDKN